MSVDSQQEITVVLEPEPVKPARRTRTRQHQTGADSADAPEVQEVGEQELPPRGEVEPEPVPVIATPDKLRKTAPNSKPPSVDEWQDFIGRVVIRAATNAYVIVMLGDEELSPQEFEAIALSREDLAEMSAPLASLANKSSLARKHGRSIIAAGDSWEAVLSLFLWGRKVNRIARKHRKGSPQASRVVQGTVIGQNGDQFNGTAGPNVSQESEGFGPGPGFNIYNPGTG